MWKTSKVTIELDELLRSGFKLWDFDYPSFYEGAEKEAFEQKVIDHYRFRQIGQETPARFKHYFQTRVREIMPYYIQRYKSVKLMEDVGDPFEAYNLTEEYNENSSGSGTKTGTATVKNTGTSTSTLDSETNGSKTTSEDKVHKHLDTPMGAFENLDDYLSDASKDENTVTDSDNVATTSDTSSTSSDEGETTTSESTEDTGSRSYTLTRRGNIGVQPLGAEINAYRSALINVDMEVINELSDLFLLVY